MKVVTESDINADCNVVTGSHRAPRSRQIFSCKIEIIITLHSTTHTLHLNTRHMGRQLRVVFGLRVKFGVATASVSHLDELKSLDHVKLIQCRMFCKQTVSDAVNINTVYSI